MSRKDGAVALAIGLWLQTAIFLFTFGYYLAILGLPEKHINLTGALLILTIIFAFEALFASILTEDF